MDTTIRNILIDNRPCTNKPNVSTKGRTNYNTNVHLKNTDKMKRFKITPDVAILLYIAGMITLVVVLRACDLM